jgi:hypothetical protein
VEPESLTPGPPGRGPGTAPEADPGPAGPPGCLSYGQAVAATGVTRRHLRRLVAAGKLEAVDHGGRRWVTMTSLLSAGLTLGASRAQAKPTAGEAPSEAWGRDDEVEALRREVAVLQAVVDERGRELERVYALAGELVAVLSRGGGDGTSGHSKGDVPEIARRWRINSR